MLVRQQRVREPQTLRGVALLGRGLPGEPEDIDPGRSEGVELISEAARLGCASPRPRYCGPLVDQGVVDAADARIDENDGSCHQVVQRDASVFCRGQLDHWQLQSRQV